MCCWRMSIWGLVGVLPWAGQLERTVFIVTVGGLTLVAMVLFAVWNMPYERLEWIRRFFRPGGDEDG